MTAQKGKGKTTMPPISQWNPVIVRLFEKMPEFTEETTFTEIADKIEGVTKHDFSYWTRGSKMGQDKIQAIVRFLIKKNVSPQDIIYVVSGENISESGAFRLLNGFTEETEE